MEAEQDQEVVVLPCNWDAFEVLRRCQTQWRVGMAGATGLDYNAVETVMRLTDVADPTDCFDRLQILELATLNAMHARRD